MAGVWGYDDDFILTLNERVLVASQASMVAAMTPVDNSYVYDWGAINDTELDYAVDYYY